jgi:mRNA interferase RelE/StbE
VNARRYALQFRPAALRQLRKLPRDALQRIRAATEALRDEPRPEGATKLAGAHDLWRIRVGNYRVVYAIDDDVLVVTVVRAAHRREVYRR